MQKESGARVMSTVPKHLGKYELLERLGYGGIAEVWKAQDTRLQRFVAIKILKPDLREDPTFTKRFQSEAELIARLHHPNIVQIHDFQTLTPNEGSTETPLAYMVMDYIEGRTLADYIQETSSRGNMPSAAEIVSLFTSISLAIDYAHQKGMIHRDIKPANILLDSHNTASNAMGEPILTDFGVAKLMSTSTSTLSAMQMGTPLYISPEQAQGYPGNERSDLYSLGVILYEIVTGVPPFRGETAVEVLSQHVNSQPTDPVLINPAVPPTLTLVIMRILAKEPEERFSSASALTAAIAEALKQPIPEVLGTPTYPLDAEDMPTHIAARPVFPASSNPSRSDVATHAISGGSSSTPNFTPMLLYPTPAGQVRPAQMGNVGAPLAPPPFIATPTRQARSRKGPFIALIAALILILIASGLGVAFFLVPSSPFRVVPTSPIVGDAFYVSSGQISTGTARGIADQMKINLHNIANPASGKSYYLWLLPDKTPEKNPDDTGPRPVHPPLLLTNNLTVTNGTVNYFYAGDAQHNNLLSTTSRLLITEETAGQNPTAPSTDQKTWRYYAEIPQEQIPNDVPGFTALIHIRHLFYNETDIEVLGLPGGLDFWMYKNSEKILEWAISAHDYWQGADTSPGNLALIRNQLVRILVYLDGTKHYQTDLPADTPLLVDPRIAQVALLSVGGQGKAQVSTYKTDPPGYVDHVQLHVGQVARAPHLSKEMLQHATNILDAVSRAGTWLTKVRSDAVQLFQMSQDLNQLKQPAAGVLLNDMATNAQYAYLGNLDPTTNTVQPGILQAHYEIQQLAVLEVSKNVPKSL
jgi:eukaryotic-like serine/threonine-protein kinase